MAGYSPDRSAHVKVQVRDAVEYLIALQCPTVVARLVWAVTGNAAANPDDGAYSPETSGRLRVKRCDGNPALISLDGGDTWPIEAVEDVTEQSWYAFPADAEIMAKSKTADVPAANLTLEIA